MTKMACHFAETIFQFVLFSLAVENVFYFARTEGINVCPKEGY